MKHLYAYIQRYIEAMYDIAVCTRCVPQMGCETRDVADARIENERGRREESGGKGNKRKGIG
jgi:hypothetical protein